MTTSAVATVDSIQRDELLQLARMVSMRPELVLEVSPQGNTWSFDHKNALISVPLSDLRDRSEDFCRGLTLHEAAHATVTRLFEMLPLQLLRRPEVKALLNVVEDCRIEEWLLQRFPGSAPWIREYNDRLFSSIRFGKPPESLSAQFLSGILAKWWFGEVPESFDDVVKQSLAACEDGLQEAVRGSQPPRSRAESPFVRELYEESPLKRIFLYDDYVDPPSGFEMLARLWQWKMWVTVYYKILPTFEALLEKDSQNGKRPSFSRWLLQFVPDHTGRPYNQRLGSVQANLQSTSGGSGGTQGGWEKAVEKALALDPQDLYLKVWAKLSSQIDELADYLLRLFQMRSRLRWERGFSSGARLDMRVAMQYEADSRNYTKLWQRKSLPFRIDPAFMVLFDNSGSMSGELAERAFDGLVLLSEVCARLQLPLEIWSFNSGYTHLLTWEDTLTQDVRAKLGRLPQSCSGGTDFGGALGVVEQRLPSLPFRERFLIALSDGLPADRTSTTDAVKRLSRKGVHCIGMGIGSGTTQLAEYFPKSMTEIAVGDIPAAFVKILRDCLKAG